MVFSRAAALTLLIVVLPEVDACTFGGATSRSGSGGTGAGPDGEAAAGAGAAGTGAGASSGGRSSGGVAGASGGATSTGAGENSGGQTNTGGAGGNSGTGGASPGPGGASPGTGGGSSGTGGAAAAGGTGGVDASVSNGGAGASGAGGADRELPSPCGPCPSGLCLDGGLCAACASDLQCSTPTPRCNPVTHACVACLGGSGDNCPAGDYCDPVGLTCLAGCKDDSTCASGSCAVSHDCDRCVADDECVASEVCSTGTCMSSCTTTTDCPTGFTCCGSRCADLTADHAHCAACGAACSAEDYCGSLGCTPGVVANVCDALSVTVLEDGLDVDDGLAPAIESALSAKCASHPPSAVVDQSASIAINPVTGRPVANGTNLLVAIGGPYGQKDVAYLESSAISPVSSAYRVGTSNSDRFYLTTPDAGTGAVLVDTPDVASNTHDFFLIAVSVDPISGSRVLEIYGFYSAGTAAGEWFFENRMLTSLATYTHSYYVYEWTHGDAGPLPGAADSFKPIASGD